MSSKSTFVSPTMKLVPVIVTGVPPSDGPTVGVMVLAVGAGTYVYVNGAVSPPGVNTTTSTSPAAWAGGLALSDRPSATSTLPARTPSNVTVAPGTKLVPSIATLASWPPTSG